jgi:hypothetical protein
VRHQAEAPRERRGGLPTWMGTAGWAQGCELKPLPSILPPAVLKHIAHYQLAPYYRFPNPISWYAIWNPTELPNLSRRSCQASRYSHSTTPLE